MADPNAVISQFAQLAGAGGSTGKPTQGYYGPMYGPAGGRGAARDSTEQRVVGDIRTVQQMVTDYRNWTDDQKNKLRSTLGLIDHNALTATDEQLEGIWAGYAQRSADYYSIGQTLTPWDLIAKDVAVKSNGSLAGTKTVKSTSTNLTSLADAGAIFQSAAQQLLGRDPTQKEIAAFQANLNAQERQNPVTTTTSTTTNAQGEAVSQQSTSSGGIGAAGSAKIAQDALKNNPEYAQVQAATTYHNAMMQMIMRGY